MRDTEVLVHFRPFNREVYVLPGTRLIEAAAEAGVILDFPCGGAGTCGKCRVIVVQNAAEPTPVERDRFSAAELQAGWRLACQTKVSGPTEVEIPPGSRTAGAPKIFVESAANAGDRPHDFEPGDAENEAFAVALDLGTTTLAAELLDLAGASWAIEARLNPQTRFGDDVLSRILHAQTADGLQQLQQIVAAAVDEMIGALCGRAGVPRERIHEIAVAGNTAMQQLFRGVDSTALGKVPFMPASRQSVACRAAELGIHIHPLGNIYIMPVIGGFVGGDTVAGILAVDLVAAQRPTLLIDVGTNGEIALWADGKLSTASAAAGPAFEGARISCGMRGCDGAIEKAIVADGRLRLNVIGNAAPSGVCGSGLIDVAAELLRHGVLASHGRLLASNQLSADVLPDLADRLVLHEGQVAFMLAAETETADGRPIVLTQRDFRELQLATGAIRAGIAILLRRAGLSAADLDRVLIGGGFGNFIRRANAQRIGLLPSRIEHHRIRYMGNTSLAGARLAALSRVGRAAAEAIANRAEHVDLSTDAEFQREFADAMIFPEE
jgi:uncharacterized 2Fe-2S/4Fe-4S cluster protein (DUF4445 family)